MSKLKVAVIGAGAMGASHARIYSELKNAELVAIADTNSETLEGVSSKYGAKKYSDYKKMLNDSEIDAVSICVPTIMHKKAALECMERKKHVLVEKPIADSIQEAEEMIASSKKNNVKMMIGHIERFNPVVSEIKKRIRRNELGKIYKVSCSRISPFPKRILDVGVITDLGIHEIDILNYLIDGKIERVFAETARRIHSKHEDLMIGTLRFSNDIIGVIDTNWLTPKKIREISVIGEKGMFFANYLMQELYFYENDFTSKNAAYDGNFMSVIEGKSTKIPIEKKEPLLSEIEAFLECISSGANPPITGEDGKKALLVAQKFVESSKLKKALEL